MIDESFKYNPEIESVHGSNKVWTEIFNSTKKVSDEQKEEIMKKLYFLCQYEVGMINSLVNRLLAIVIITVLVNFLPRNPRFSIS